jgi:drug/metabolite transporter (DMT)-like permease
VASAFKLSLRYLTFAELLLYASLASVFVLTAMLLAGGKLAELKTWPRREFLRSALLGFLNPFLYYLVLFKAYSLLPAQEAQPLNFTWPIVLVVLSIVILGQAVRYMTLLAMAISLLGVLVIATRGNVLDWQITNGLGVILALSSTVIWALYWLYGIKDNRDPIVRLCLNFAFGTVFVTVYMLLLEPWRMPPIEGLAGAFYVGLFEMGITFVLWLKALKLSRTTAEVSNLIYLSPFLSLLVIHVAVGEPIYPSTVIGLGLIVSGILLQQFSLRQRPSS